MHDTTIKGQITKASINRFVPSFKLIAMPDLQISNKDVSGLVFSLLKDLKKRSSDNKAHHVSY